jgi:hypothetical protein
MRMTVAFWLWTFRLMGGRRSIPAEMDFGLEMALRTRVSVLTRYCLCYRIRT